jgi:hypothetical protein
VIAEPAPTFAAKRVPSSTAAPRNGMFAGDGTRGEFRARVEAAPCRCRSRPECRPRSCASAIERAACSTGQA